MAKGTTVAHCDPSHLDIEPTAHCKLYHKCSANSKLMLMCKLEFLEEMGWSKKYREKAN